MPPFKDPAKQREAQKRWDAANRSKVAASKRDWAKRNPEKVAGGLVKGQQRKHEQLGMHFSTACGQLRRNILFSFVQQLSLDTCFKCSELIVSVDELSIEHKIDWMYASPDLFWDLDNIAFSHRKCNRKRATVLT